MTASIWRLAPCNNRLHSSCRGPAQACASGRQPPPYARSRFAAFRTDFGHCGLWDSSDREFGTARLSRTTLHTYRCITARAFFNASATHAESQLATLSALPSRGMGQIVSESNGKR
ncbi:hypothetical protein Tamer19_35970 [Cupriavidus sp. TA19]|nr:hypothetical protein Tamer19_35970 [Cupriavidus sp. TA19]